MIIPTYNEEEFIQQRLDNIYLQDYPRDLLEVIVIDSASRDRTVEIARKWASEHKDINLKLIEEPERRGKLHAVLKSLKHISKEIDVVVFTDADAFWEPNALSRALSYFADPSVGAVTASIVYADSRTRENVYRNYYNVVRVCESRIYSTPVHNGPLLAIRAELIRRYGLPEFPGSDDSSFGSYIAFLGYRAIQADDIVMKEPMRGSEFRRKVRRAQHLVLNFLKTRSYAKRRGVYRRVKPFERIWWVEWWLHIVNPWLLAVSATFLALRASLGSIAGLALLGTGLALLALSPTYRVWVLQQLYLIIAMVRSLRTKEVVWSR